jgi:acetyltransferase-like isoleucine patch superfamily enzyme
MQKLEFRKCGQDVDIYPLAKIVAPERIEIGDSVIIDDFTMLYPGTNFRIGSFVHLASYVLVTGGGEFLIDDFAAVSSGTKIFTGNDDYLGGSLTNPTIPAPYRHVTRSFVHIKKHALIGANCVILPGVTIGEGARIGAGSVVTRDVEPWGLYVGTPATWKRGVPRETILKLEADLKRALYDEDSKYLPKDQRKFNS